MLFYLILLIADAAAVWLVLRRRPAIGIPAGFLVMAGTTLVASLTLAPHIFAAMALASHGIFVHGTLVAFVSAWLLRRRSQPAAAALAAISVGLLAVGVDAFLVEPHWLEVTERQVAVEEAAPAVRIVVLADIQTDNVSAYERRVLKEAAALEPDLVLLPGDYIQLAGPGYAAQSELLRSAFLASSLAPPLGGYAVPGNTDQPGWARIFDGTGIEPLDRTTSMELPSLSAAGDPDPPSTGGETSTRPEPPAGIGGPSPVHLTGLTLEDSSRTNLQISRPGPGVHIVFGHMPDFTLGRVDADLLIAGHTHGGQVRLPGIGPLLTLSRVPRDWAAGRTDLASGGTLIVSRGIGMERGLAPRLRFLCRPELAVIDLVPKAAAPPVGRRQS